MTKPIDPSPTPWDSNTWGYYCDTCEKFFDLLEDGQVKTYGDCTCDYWHKPCGQQARYITYDRDATRPVTEEERERARNIAHAVRDWREGEQVAPNIERFHGIDHLAKALRPLLKK